MPDDLSANTNSSGSVSARGQTIYDPRPQGIHEPDGPLLRGATNDRGLAGVNSRVFFTLGAGGTCCVVADDYGSASGTYRVSLTQL